MPTSSAKTNCLQSPRVLTIGVSAFWNVGTGRPVEGRDGGGVWQGVPLLSEEGSLEELCVLLHFSVVFDLKIPNYDTTQTTKILLQNFSISWTRPSMKRVVSTSLSIIVPLMAEVRTHVVSQVSADSLQSMRWCWAFSLRLSCWWRRQPATQEACLLVEFLAFTFAICHRLSVCLSVWNVRSPILKRLKFSAMFLRHLVRWPSIDIDVKFYGDRPRGTLSSGELNTRGLAKYRDFGPIERYISETVQDRSYKLVLITNRRSHMGFRLVPNSVTLNDLERRNNPNRRAISPNSVAFGPYYVKVVEDTIYFLQQKCRPNNIVFGDIIIICGDIDRWSPPARALKWGITWKRCKMGSKLVLITNRKSYVSFRLVPKSVTLNDLERRNGCYFTEFDTPVYQHITVSICGGIYIRVYCIL